MNDLTAIVAAVFMVRDQIIGDDRWKQGLPEAAVSDTVARHSAAFYMRLADGWMKVCREVGESKR